MLIRYILLSKSIFILMVAGVLLMQNSSTPRPLLKSPTQPVITLAATPLDAQSYVRLGINALEEGNYEQAALYLTSAVEIDPDMAIAYIKRARTYSFLHESDLAFNDINQAISLNPNIAEAYIVRGNLNKGQDLDLAFSDIEHALALDPENAEAYLSRASVRILRGDTTTHIRMDLLKAIDLDREYAEAYTMLGLTYEDNTQAINFITLAIEIDPENILHYIARASVYQEQGDIDRAISDYTHAVEIDPNSADAYYRRGTLYFHQENYGQAIADYTEVIRIEPDSVDAYYGRGSAYYNLYQDEKALEDFEHYIELAGNEADPEVISLVDKLRKKLSPGA